MKRMLARLVRRWRWIAAGVILAALWLRLGPLPAGLVDLEARASTVVVDRYGEVLYEVRGADGTRGELLTADTIPDALVHATLAAEDVRFFSHVGVDPIAVARATLTNLRARRVLQGGSTITQQVAKLLLAKQSGNGARRGFGDKWREAVVALRLEHRYSKREILALYLNLAPYGNQIVGAGRAARAYFGRDVATLTPAEAAFLAALPQQPGRFNPWKSVDPARPRQQRILRTMAERGWLTADALATARTERLALRREATDALAPHFVETMLSRAPKGRRIGTSLDATLQRIVHGVIAAQRAALDAHHAANVAVAVLDNRTGEWLAWEGSGDYFDGAHGGTIDGVMTPRQPGSALKPFTYATAFERGYHPAQMLPDVPSQFPTAEQGILYSPRNYDGKYRGPLAIRTALAGSENVPAVALASEVGVPAIVRLLRRAGFSTLDRNASYYGLGLTLGNAEVRLAEMVAAYAMLARGGELLEPHGIQKIDGRAVAVAAPTRVVSERTAFWLTDILSDDEARAYVFGRGGSLEFPFKVAAKTGTSQAYHDNWAIGYTREVTVGVWVGNFDRTPLQNSSGVTGAGPIFHDVMMAAVERVHGYVPVDDTTPVATPTADIHRGDVCALSGMAPGAACPRRTTDWLPNDAPLATCTWHHMSDEGLVTVWPTIYETWARKEYGPRVLRSDGLTVLSSQRRSDLRAPGPSDRLTVGPSDRERLMIDAPVEGATYLLDPTLRSEFQTLPLRVRGAAPGQVEWFVNDVPVGQVSRTETLRWPMTRGTHAIRARDAAGHSVETRVVVR